MPTGIYNRRPLSEETKKKIAEAHRGKPLSAEHRQSVRVANTGKKHSIETRKKMSVSRSGAKNHNWKGGIYPEIRKLRKTLEYKLWREAVFKRDNYTCVWCFRRGVELNADHIKPFSLFPELRLAIDNGRTLCVSCHRTTETYGKRLNQVSYATS